MLEGYPANQVIPGQHPEHKNYWHVASIPQAEKALAKAVSALNEGFDAFFVYTSEDIHFDILRDDGILNELEWILSADCTIFFSEFGDNEWQKWDHQLRPRCMTNIKVVRNN